MLPQRLFSPLEGNILFDAMLFSIVRFFMKQCGMVDELGVMIAAVVIAVMIMMLSSDAISNFVDRHPTVKILALSFLLLIGMMLVIEGMHQHIPKGYIYIAMAFSVFVEMLNLRMRSKIPVEPVKLRVQFSQEISTEPSDEEKSFP